MDQMERITATGIVPVVVLAKAEDAIPAARALLAGGIDIMEITMRTDAALESIRLIRESAPEMLVGALGGLLASASSCALSKHHISRIFRDMLSAIAGTLTALIAQLVYPALQVNFAIIGALMVLTPGVALTMGIRDIINSDYLSGTIRLVDALLVAGCLAVGVTLGYTLLNTVTGVVW